MVRLGLQLICATFVAYLRRGRSRRTRARERVASFLQQVYESVAETLPDVRDDTFDSPALVVEVPELADSYASALHKDDDRPSVKKEKRRKLGIEVNVSRNNLEIRYLPPGHVRDYWEQIESHWAQRIWWKARGFSAHSGESGTKSSNALNSGQHRHIRSAIRAWDISYWSNPLLGIWQLGRIR